MDYILDLQTIDAPEHLEDDSEQVAALSLLSILGRCGDEVRQY